LSDLINASDVKAQRRLNQVTIAARNYEEEDEDEVSMERKQEGEGEKRKERAL
jgi:hypothetical protein